MYLLQLLDLTTQFLLLLGMGGLELLFMGLEGLDLLGLFYQGCFELLDLRDYGRVLFLELLEFMLQMLVLLVKLLYLCLIVFCDPDL